MSDEQDRSGLRDRPDARGSDSTSRRRRRRRRPAGEGPRAAPAEPAAAPRPEGEGRAPRRRHRRHLPAAEGPREGQETRPPREGRGEAQAEHRRAAAEGAHPERGRPGSAAPTEGRGRSRRRGRRRPDGQRGEPRAPAESVAHPGSEPPGEPALAFPDEDAWDLSSPDATLEPAGRGRARAQEPGGEDEGSESDETSRPPSEHSILDPPAAGFDPDGDDEIDPGEDPADDAALYEVAQVRLRDRTRVSELDQGDLVLAPGDQVVVETEQGYTLGTVERTCRRACCTEAPHRVLRRVDGNDLRQQTRNFAREREAYLFCRERIKQRNLPMKLIRVEYLHGGNKAIFYFAAENRVDFRELVKDLASRLHTRIVMRQVGVRDEARMTGGIGSCGCELCCATWLPRFEPVSIRMAKDQNLVLNPQKVSGQCGRLKCCLAYEEAQYVAARKSLPKVGKRVSTPGGEGKVQDVDILRQRVRVHHDDGSDQTYSADQVHALAAPGPRDHQGA